MFDTETGYAEALRRIAHAKETHDTEVDLKALELTELPEELYELIWLKELHLWNNKLTLLPNAIGNFISLQYLDVSHNYLTTLPNIFDSLSQLQSMILFSNRLKTLPDTLSTLTQLQLLLIDNNHLITLPDWIGNLTQLQRLHMSGNSFSTLPEEIGNLPHLQALDISMTGLNIVPAWITKLTTLRKLYVDYNQLTVLPETLGNLIYLQNLYVSSNQLTALPDWMGNFTHLQILEVSGNHITALPTTLNKLTQLQRIYISNNPLNLPDEMIPERSEELTNNKIPYRTLTFLRQLWQGSRKLNEAKVILVGEGDVGKTSLVKRLRDNAFDPHEPKTEGIAIQPWTLPFQGESVQLNVWDFGGQEIMHATHQFFLTKRSLYVVVLDSRRDERANRLEYWLKIIASVAADAPVLVVGNQTDQHPLDLDERGLKFKYPQIKAIIATSCKSGAGIAELRGEIEREIGAMKHVHDLVPLKWWDVKQQIEHWPQDFISHERWSEMCAQHDIGDEFVQAVLLRLLNDLGTVLSYHDDPRLADTNVLNPEWVTNGVYTLLNNQDLLQRKHGILSITDLPQILSVHGKRYPAHRCHFITEMMEKFELCFRIDGDRNRVLIPDLLPKAAPETGVWDDALHFRYAYPVLPSSIMSRFIVRSQGAIEGELRWRSGVVLRSDEDNRALVVADSEAAQIDIHISGSPANRRRFLSAIRHSFEQIHNTLSGLKHEVKELVPLPNSQVFFPYANLLKLETRGIGQWYSPDEDADINVHALLDGYESRNERQARQIGDDYEKAPIEHLQNLVNVKTDRLRVLQVQKASFGDSYVPPHIAVEVDRLSNEIKYIEGIIKKRGRG